MKFEPIIISKRLFGRNKKGEIYMVLESEYVAKFKGKRCLHIELVKAETNLAASVVFRADINEDEMLTNPTVKNQFEKL